MHRMERNASNRVSSEGKGRMESSHEVMVDKANSEHRVPNDADLGSSTENRSQCKARITPNSTRESRRLVYDVIGSTEDFLKLESRGTGEVAEVELRLNEGVKPMRQTATPC